MHLYAKLKDGRIMVVWSTDSLKETMTGYPLEKKDKWTYDDIDTWDEDDLVATDNNLTCLDAQCFDYRNRLKDEIRNTKQELQQPIIEEFIPGHQRRFSLHPSGRVEVDIRAAVTSDHKHYGSWIFWGRFITLEDARRAHDDITGRGNK